MRQSEQPAATPPVRRVQLLAITIVGLLAVITFVVSLLIGGGSGEMLNGVAGGLGILCGVIGISFAIVGNRR